MPSLRRTLSLSVYFWTLACPVWPALASPCWVVCDLQDDVRRFTQKVPLCLSLLSISVMLAEKALEALLGGIGLKSPLH